MLMDRGIFVTGIFMPMRDRDGIVTVFCLFRAAPLTGE